MVAQRALGARGGVDAALRHGVGAVCHGPRPQIRRGLQPCRERPVACGCGTRTHGRQLQRAHLVLALRQKGRVATSTLSRGYKYRCEYSVRAGDCLVSGPARHSLTGARCTERVHGHLGSGRCRWRRGVGRLGILCAASPPPRMVRPHGAVMLAVGARSQNRCGVGVKRSYRYQSRTSSGVPVSGETAFPG